MSSPYAFVTVGTTRFDDLITEVLTEAFAAALVEASSTLASLKGVPLHRVVVQAGNSDLGDKVGETPSALSLSPEGSKGKAVTFEVYRFKASIAEDVEGASLIISHAGAGSIFEAVRANKPLIVAVNNKLADNHQTELASAMSERKHFFSCDPATLAATLKAADFSKLKPLPSAEPGLKAFAACVDDLMGYSDAPASSRLSSGSRGGRVRGSSASRVDKKKDR
jgi:beta-1,4-N-acetylglucosaminyltransferase